MKGLLLAVCVLGLLSPSAFAQDRSPEQRREDGRGLRQERVTRDIPSGTSWRIGFFTALNPDCTSSGNVNIRVTKQPEHGSTETTTATNYPAYPKANLRARCN